MKARRVGFICLTLLTGCVTQGRDFPSQFDWIRKTETSQNDVKMVLGAPFSVGNSNGVPTWTYGFYRYSLFGKSEVKELKFYWLPDRTIRSFSFNSSFPADIHGAQRAR